MPLSYASPILPIDSASPAVLIRSLKAQDVNWLETQLVLASLDRGGVSWAGQLGG